MVCYGHSKGFPVSSCVVLIKKFIAMSGKLSVRIGAWKRGDLFADQLLMIGRRESVV